MNQVKNTYIVELDGKENPYLGIVRSVVAYVTFDGRYYLDIGNLFEITAEQFNKLKSK